METIISSQFTMVIISIETQKETTLFTTTMTTRDTYTKKVDILTATNHIMKRITTQQN